MSRLKNIKRNELTFDTQIKVFGNDSLVVYENEDYYGKDDKFRPSLVEKDKYK